MAQFYSEIPFCLKFRYHESEHLFEKSISEREIKRGSFVAGPLTPSRGCQMNNESDLIHIKNISTRLKNLNIAFLIIHFEIVKGFK